MNDENMVSAKLVVGVVGLGYVGLPLALAFARKQRTIGFDLSREKVEAYRQMRDPSGEVPDVTFRAARHLEATTDSAALRDADIVVVAVPTPVDSARRPDFGPLRAACRMLGPHLKSGAAVVFESTVYPGATEEVCIPALEEASAKRWKRDFFVGYSPERINPGDAEHTLERIVKVVAADTPETLERVSQLYGSIIPAGVHRASSIRVAEAAKVIENTQRDLNIALMNELAIIFHRMGIDTHEVLAAAGTKWNFLKFVPGLVGGHCIGVDPYYLTHQAEKYGYHPEVILSGRRINDGMGAYIAHQIVRCLVAGGRPVNGARVAMLGLAFKENCADIRNTKVVDVIRELEAFGCVVSVCDPRASPEHAADEYQLPLVAWEDLPPVDAIVLAVAHDEFLARPLGELLSRVVPGGCVIDVKSKLDKEQVESRGLRFWRL
jgi:UDP-N-acetyl-D-glucosamine/UDP-N-acetyl-D-galactosamine dehydrogenase